MNNKTNNNLRNDVNNFYKEQGQEVFKELKTIYTLLITIFKTISSLLVAIFWLICHLIVIFFITLSIVGVIAIIPFLIGITIYGLIHDYESTITILKLLGSFFGFFGSIFLAMIGFAYLIEYTDRKIKNKKQLTN